MEYRVTIQPTKEKEFLQLLKAWESLGVVLRYEKRRPRPAEEEDAIFESSNKPKARKATDAAWEMAEPYKDLLD